MANSNITLEIAETVQKVYAKLRPWDNAPKTTITQYGDKFSITTDYDHLGKIFQAPNNEWSVECVVSFGCCASIKPTLEDAITYLIKTYFGMR